MLILARVNGYHSPYTPQTIMEEEAKTLYGDVFTLAERDFFKHRLLTLFPKITDKGIETSITFLEQQKLANCPCFVHTAQRGYEWTVFRRQPEIRTYEKMIQLMMRISSVLKLMKLPFQQMILNTTPALWIRDQKPLVLLL